MATKKKPPPKKAPGAVAKEDPNAIQLFGGGTFTPAPGGLTPAFGLPAGPGYGTQEAAVSERYRGLSFMPASELEVDEMMDLQKQMDEAGLYDGPYTLGVWDSATARAYEKLLRTADERKQPLSAALAQALDDKAREKAYLALGKKAEKPPFAVTLTNPENIKAAAENMAIDLYGQGVLPEGTVESITAAIHDAERQAAMQTYAQSYGFGDADPAGGEFAGQIDPELLIEQKLREANPNQVAARAFGKTFEAILGSIASPVNLTGPNG